MDALEAILTRRSIRKYTDKPVGQETIAKLVKAAMAAPSAHNQQPWRFVVVREQKTRDEISRFHPYAKMLKGAPVAIVVCADHTLEKDPPAGYWVQDCAAATQNILLAAHSLGLGAVWLGFHPRQQRIEELKKLIELPEHVTPFCVISLGYPAEEKGPSERYDPSRVCHERWG